ncbi:MAG TPA: type II secretion system protein [Thermodesulfobacteriota bacterium]|nr:type II secretion system protein [Thermodesulfobacteriota bacterium]
MSKLRDKQNKNGFTVVELLIVAAFIGVLLAIAIPNLFKARIASNEANARKAMQTLRDAEAEFYEQDLDDDGRDYTDQITGSESLRDPEGTGDEEDALIDSTFEDAAASGNTAQCNDSKAGYCIRFAQDVDVTDPSVLQTEYGWEASMIAVRRTGIKDFAVYQDGVIRCTASLEETGEVGKFQANRATSVACDN